MNEALDLSLIGCSDYPVLAGIASYRSKHDLWMRCAHGMEVGDSPELSHMGDWGKLTEHATAVMLMRELYGEEPEPMFESTLVKPPSHTKPDGRPWQRYSLDFVTSPSGDIPTMAIECKSRNYWSFKNAGWGEQDGSDDVAIEVLAQVQGQLEAVRYDRDRWTGTSVPDLEQIHVAVMVDGQKLRWFLVQRNQEVGARLVEAAEQFWRDHIEPQVPPPVDGSLACRDALGALHPGGPDLEMRDATPDEQELVETLQGVKAAVKEQKKMQSELENRLRAQIGDDLGIRAEGFTAKWLPQEGRVGYMDVVKSIVSRYQVPDVEVQAIMEAHRSARLRKLEVRKKKSK